MRFSITAVLAFAASALAQDPTPDFDPIYTPTSGENIAAGSAFKITWDPKDYTSHIVSLQLIGGATQDTQVKIADIACKLRPELVSKRTADCV